MIIKIKLTWVLNTVVVHAINTEIGVSKLLNFIETIRRRDESVTFDILELYRTYSPHTFNAKLRLTTFKYRRHIVNRWDHIRTSSRGMIWFTSVCWYVRDLLMWYYLSFEYIPDMRIRAPFTKQFNWITVCDNTIHERQFFEFMLHTKVY